MIFIDLDNTVYNQGQYLRYVYKEISKFIEKEFKINSKDVYKYLVNITKTKTLHYPIFDDLVKDFKIDIDPKELVNMYRKLVIDYLKNKKLILYKEALNILKNENVVIYTEGREELQKAKIENIEKNYNLKLNYIIVKDKLDKENIKIFEEYSPKIYIGDDIFKDFYIPNKLNILTVRVLTGIYKHISNETVKEEYRPKVTIKNLSYFKR